MDTEKKTKIEKKINRLNDNDTKTDEIIALFMSAMAFQFFAPFRVLFKFAYTCIFLCELLFFNFLMYSLAFIGSFQCACNIRVLKLLNVCVEKF